jgi:hypothetical protein
MKNKIIMALLSVSACFGPDALSMAQASSSLDPLSSAVVGESWDYIPNAHYASIYQGKVIAYETNIPYLQDNESYVFNEEGVRYG